MRPKTIKEMSGIFLGAVMIALLVNSFSPVGIPLIGQWDESVGALRANPDDKMAAPGLEIDNMAIAKQIFDQGSTLFVDARSKTDFLEGHVAGAISLPVSEFDDRIETFFNQYLPNQAMIIYCSGRLCQDSHHLAQKLMEFGYENISIMIDGFPGWKARGYPIE
jgi:rhodanese-related sulfurtransferase